MKHLWDDFLEMSCTIIVGLLVAVVLGWIFYDIHNRIVTVNAEAAEHRRLFTVDLCVAEKTFLSCMESHPAPQSTHYADGDEVVFACRSSATAMAERLRAHIEPECVGD